MLALQPGTTTTGIPDKLWQPHFVTFETRLVKIVSQKLEWKRGFRTSFVYKGEKLILGKIVKKALEIFLYSRFLLI